VAEAIGASMAASDTLLLGRRTYEEFAAVWPGRGTDNPVGAWMNNTPKRVVSTTLESVDWHSSELVKGDLVEEISELKQQPGATINISGSGTLVRRC
jgi:dihydrofolate reductase